ncbi:MAG: hypothetical protein ABEI52_11195 [Halobacteriaceae archaeon]
MKRRTYLQAAGVAGLGGFTGCLGAAQQATDSQSSTPTPSAPTVSLTAVNGFADQYPVTFDVSVETPTFTGQPDSDEGHPASVTVTLTNESNEMKKFGLGHRTVFSTVYSTDNTYTLLPPEYYRDSLEAACWQLAEKVAFPMVIRITKLPAGKSKSRTFDLLATTNADTCLPTGSVTFEETYAESVPSEEYTPDRRKERPVSFTLQIT